MTWLLYLPLLYWMCNGNSQINCFKICGPKKKVFLHFFNSLKPALPAATLGGFDLIYLEFTISGANSVRRCSSAQGGRRERFRRQLTWRPVLCLWVVCSHCSSVHVTKSHLLVIGSAHVESRGLWCWYLVCLFSWHRPEELDMGLGLNRRHLILQTLF